MSTKETKGREDCSGCLRLQAPFLSLALHIFLEIVLLVTAVGLWLLLWKENTWALVVALIPFAWSSVRLLCDHLPAKRIWVWWDKDGKKHLHNKPLTHEEKELYQPKDPVIQAYSNRPTWTANSQWDAEHSHFIYVQVFWRNGELYFRATIYHGEVVGKLDRLYQTLIWMDKRVDPLYFAYHLAGITRLEERNTKLQGDLAWLALNVEAMFRATKQGANLLGRSPYGQFFHRFLGLVIDQGFGGNGAMLDVAEVADPVVESRVTALTTAISQGRAGADKNRSWCDLAVHRLDGIELEEAIRPTEVA